MISILALMLFSLQATQVPIVVAIEAPDSRVVHALQRAKRELHDFPADEQGLNALARSALGLVDPAREAQWSLLALQAFWNTRGDTTLLRERWPELRANFGAATRDTAHEPGLWLATLDAALALSQVTKDVTTDSLARSVYADAEARLNQTTSLYGLAFGLYDDAHADTLLIRMLPYVRAFWPIGNGLAALALYEYHRDSTAFEVLEQMAETNAFTAPLFVLPLMRGLIGWETDAANRAAALEPHLPPTWTSLQVTNLPVGVDRVDATIRHERGHYSILLHRQVPGRQLSLRIAPALPAGARVRNVTVNERDVPVQVESNAHDVHVVVEMAFRREAQIDIEYEVPRKRASIR